MLLQEKELQLQGIRL